MHSRVPFLALALAWLSACGVVPLPIGPSDPTAPPPLRAQDAEFRTLVARWFGVWSNDDARVAEAESLFTSDADALFFDGLLPLEGEFGAEGWRAASRRAATSRFAKFEVVPREGVWLRRNGDRAIASVPFVVDLQNEAGRAAETDGHATLVWEKRAGTWKIVHEHTSLALLEDWLGGIDADLEGPESDHVRAREPEFQRFIDDYLTVFDASRTSDAVRSNAPSRFFDPTGDVVVWDPTSRRPLMGWAGVAAHRDAMDLRVQLSNKQSRRDVRVWKSGDMAWATFTFTARATRRDGDRFEVAGRQTNVFQKIDGAWRIVHEHASIPYGPSGTPAIPSEVALARGGARASRSGSSTSTTGVVNASAPRADAANETTTFAGLVREQASAWTTLDGRFDWSRILATCCRDGFVILDDLAPGSFTSRAELETSFPAFANFVVVPRDDLRVVRHGDVAWTTNTQDLRFTPAEGTEQERVRVQTAIWELRAGRWYLVHVHTSTRR